MSRMRFEFKIRETFSVTRWFVLLIFIFCLVSNFAYSQSCPSISVVRQPTSFDAWTGYSGTANNFSIYATSTGGGPSVL